MENISVLTKCVVLFNNEQLLLLLISFCLLIDNEFDLKTLRILNQENHLLLRRILKLLVDILNDSTPLMSLKEKEHTRYS